MSKLMDFLMSDGAGKEVQTTVNISGFPEPFTIRSITEAQNKEIRKSCQTTTFNKKTHQKEVETNNDLYNCRLIATCCLDPNFKDAELQAHHGVRGAGFLTCSWRFRISTGSPMTSTSRRKKQKTDRGGQW